ncbi:hypothetical protein HJG60_011024 [Phyllostomus discolor]|uniref:Uncharacterized protein n=1 Tax=Phyllostomus discolor TaxID=89673 RepID=A0A834A848_9CHIR|nr:hypothetical protein HJG60_011024 [Phyllostomus discolor]
MGLVNAASPLPAGCWEPERDLGVAGMEGSGGLPVGGKDPEPGTPRAGPVSHFMVSPCPSILQMRLKKHKVKTPCRIQADGTSAPKATTSLWAAPCLPTPPLSPPSGLSLQGRAIQTWGRGSCWHHPHPPRLGGRAGAGGGQS